VRTQDPNGSERNEKYEINIFLVNEVEGTQIYMYLRFKFEFSSFPRNHLIIVFCWTVNYVESFGLVFELSELNIIDLTQKTMITGDISLLRTHLESYFVL